MNTILSLKSKFKNILTRNLIFKLTVPLLVLFVLITAILFYVYTITDKSLKAESQKARLLNEQVTEAKKDLEDLKNTDQVKRNDDLEETIKKIQTTYDDSIKVYEEMADLPAASKNNNSYKKKFAQILDFLSEKNYSSGAALLTSLRDEVKKEKESLASLKNTGIDVASLTKSTTPPASGFSRQAVDVGGTTYVIDLVAGNLSSTRVIVDTASDGDCRDNCPTLPLGTYVSRNGAYAGINGSYFCPAEYPTCAGKTNSFDTLAMGKNKHYHNSDNNVYSTLPLVVFGNGFVRFVGQSSGWGRDTGVDGVLANQPLLLSGGNVTFGGDGDPKKGSRGNRSFVANKGNTVYIGVIRSVTVAEGALVLKALGMENALNLDSGGSTALWAGGYKAGPGRNIPNAILFVNK